MNRIFGIFAMALVLVFQAACAGDMRSNTDVNNDTNTIVDVAVNNGSFKTLVTALQAASLVETLAGEGPFTVLAPTDDAFAALPPGALDALLAKPDQLAEVLKLHVVAGRAAAQDVVQLTSVVTLQGQNLAVDVQDGVSIGGAQVIQADVAASNGVIHVIDRVLLPR